MVDLFAMRWNHKQLRVPLSRSVGVGRRRLLSLNWDGLIAYPFPPTVLVTKVINKVRTSTAVVILLSAVQMGEGRDDRPSRADHPSASPSSCRQVPSRSAAGENVSSRPGPPPASSKESGRSTVAGRVFTDEAVKRFAAARRYSPIDVYEESGESSLVGVKTRLYRPQRSLPHSWQISSCGFSTSRGSPRRLSRATGRWLPTPTVYRHLGKRTQARTETSPT